MDSVEHSSPALSWLLSMASDHRDALLMDQSLKNMGASKKVSLEQFCLKEASLG